jgi:hypothetical protein
MDKFLKASISEKENPSETVVDEEESDVSVETETRDNDSDVITTDDEKDLDRVFT